MAILAFYWRMFCVTSIKLPIQILACSSIIWIIIRTDISAITFLVTLRCIPLQAFWHPSVPGSCTLKDSQFFFGTILIPAIIDIAILILPVLQIRKLQLPLVQRLGIIIMFMFGIIICASGVVIVVVSTWYNDHPDDMTWNLTPIFLWATVEVNLVTVSGTLPPVPGNLDAQLGRSGRSEFNA
ncbi:hypothetical protein ACKAV7_000004 [Fusarium commune]